MYINRDILLSPDVVNLYDTDFYNSSIIYGLPNISLDEHELNYLCREDQISDSVYGYGQYFGLGLTFLSLLEELENDQIDESETSYIKYLPSIQPFSKVNMLNQMETVQTQSSDLHPNELVDIDINLNRNPDTENYLYDDNDGKFIKVSD